MLSLPKHLACDIAKVTVLLSGAEASLPLRCYSIEYHPSEMLSLRLRSLA